MNAAAPQSGPARSAIVAPGGGYGPDGPLLMYARLAVERRGGLVRPIVWELSRDTDFSLLRRHVASQVESAVDELTAATGAAPVIVAKSLGSLAAPLVADRGLAAVWFTPLLTDEPTVAALGRATGPSLLVGGTADPYWDGETARSVAADVVDRMIPYLDGIPGSMRSSLLIDLQQGKRIEVEALQGAVVRRAAGLGVSTPVMSTLYAVLKLHAAGESR